MMIRATKLITILVLLLASAALAFGQTAATTTAAQGTTQAPVAPGSPVAAEVGRDTAQQNLKEVSVEKFEDAGLWTGVMPLDEGLIELRELTGAPSARKPIPEEQKIGITEQDNQSLGVKVTFFRRGFSQFAIVPTHPFPIEGIVKTIQIWVVGRNTNHQLSILVEDQAGTKAELPIGPLNFTGWRQLTVVVPPSLVQKDFHYGDRSGIKVDGFIVDTDPLETYGTFYIYFNDMTAVTDLFGEQEQSTDDMSDSW